MRKYGKAIGFFATAAVAVALGIFAIVGEPTWWAGVVAVGVPVISALVGKEWELPKE